jgi:hypothetical protein
LAAFFRWSAEPLLFSLCPIIDDVVRQGMKTFPVAGESGNEKHHYESRRRS